MHLQSRVAQLERIERAAIDLHVIPLKTRFAFVREDRVDLLYQAFKRLLQARLIVDLEDEFPRRHWKQRPIHGESELAAKRRSQIIAHIEAVRRPSLLQILPEISSHQIFDD